MNNISNNKSNKVNWDLNPTRIPEIEKDLNFLTKILPTNTCSKELSQTLFLWQRSVETELNKTKKFAFDTMSVERLIAETVKSSYYSGYLTKDIKISKGAALHFQKLICREKMTEQYKEYQETLYSLLKSYLLLIVPTIICMLTSDGIISEEKMSERIEHAISYEMPKKIQSGDDEISHQYKRLGKLFNLFKNIKTENQDIQNLFNAINTKKEKEEDSYTGFTIKTIRSGLPDQIIGLIEHNIRLMEEGRI